LTPEGRTGEFTSILSRVKVGRLDERHETTCVRKDGTAIRVLLTVVPIRGAVGAIAGFCVIVSDLTEAK
jgi:PAS domain S-box-containing protein